MMPIARVYHPYDQWEDYQWGMYDMVCHLDPEVLIFECEAMLGCPEWLWETMVFVSHNWGRAAEHNLTNVHRNRQAWLGQAACCMMHGAPEYITKLAWGRLSEEKREAANKVADEVIADWEEKYRMGTYFQWQNSGFSVVS